jgi:hypothetical protein
MDLGENGNRSVTGALPAGRLEIVIGGSVQKASEYHRHAEECRKLVASVSDPQQRDLLQRMAETWESLAADRERWAEQKRRIEELEKRAAPARSRG